MALLFNVRLTYRRQGQYHAAKHVNILAVYVICRIIRNKIKMRGFFAAVL